MGSKKARIILGLGILCIIVSIGYFIFFKYQILMEEEQNQIEIQTMIERQPIVHVNYINFPRLKVKRKIVFGDVDSLLNQNKVVYWNAKDDGNIYLVGHRIPTVFEILKDIKIKDEIELHWKGTMIKYTVNTIQVVEETEIPSLPSNDLLVLITCMEDDRKRLFVICHKNE